eukprot:jgi/Galph1/82/GphlegSOOS_G4848.1
MDLEEGEVPTTDREAKLADNQQELKHGKSESTTRASPASSGNGSFQATGAFREDLEVLRSVPDRLFRSAKNGSNVMVNGRNSRLGKRAWRALNEQTSNEEEVEGTLSLAGREGQDDEIEKERQRRRQQWKTILETCKDSLTEKIDGRVTNEKGTDIESSEMKERPVVERDKVEDEGTSDGSEDTDTTKHANLAVEAMEDKAIRERLLRIREESAFEESQESSFNFQEDRVPEKRRNPKFLVDIFADSPQDELEDFVDNHRKVTERTVVSVDEETDSEGYCKLHPGDRLDNIRYTVLNVAGKGVFSSVIRALEHEGGNTRDVAIKIIRNNDVMLKAAQKEVAILSKLQENDKEGKRHCIRYYRQFALGNHSCLVFESMHMNLREVLKKYGGDRGISIKAVQLYTRQLLNAVYLLQKCKIIHADLKPDNILVNEAKNIVKICDFGSACFLDECDITPYLVSRFYRAPEIILGLPYGPAIDMWSLGCCVMELYTGRIAFPGRNNNEMLRLFQELKGSFPMKMIRKAHFRSKYFDASGNFLQSAWDPISQSEIVKAGTIRPKMDLKARLMSVAETDEKKYIPLLVDLLDKIFTLDPTRRLSVTEASRHPFITSGFIE